MMNLPLCKPIPRKFQRENGLAKIDKMSLELDVTQTGAVPIWSKQVDLSVKLDYNMVVRRVCIIIMGNKEECQIPRINASIIEGGDKILQAGEILVLAKCHYRVQRDCNYADCHHCLQPSHGRLLGTCRIYRRFRRGFALISLEMFKSQHAWRLSFWRRFTIVAAFLLKSNV